MKKFFSTLLIATTFNVICLDLIPINIQPVLSQTISQENISNLSNSNPGYYTEILNHTNGTVEFTSVSTGLGENNAQQTETFAITRESSASSLSVTLKAATSQATTPLTLGTPLTNSLGFRITLLSIQGNTYTVSVESVNNTYALSHANFEFDSPSDIVSYSVMRTNGLNSAVSFAD
jgi:hypothetical protein